MLTIHKVETNFHALEFCKQFLNAKPQKRFIFGRNDYATAISNQIEVSAFVDDFTTEITFLEKPIIKTEQIPPDGLVVSSLLGHPLLAKIKLSETGVTNLDFFAFYEHSGLKIGPVRFWGKLKIDIKNNLDQYLRIGRLLEDDESKNTYNKIVNFRFSANLAHLEGFEDRQKQQYFEGFLSLHKKDEVFVDVGGFDGYTTLEFIKRCPDYRAIYIFEPDPKNMEVLKTTVRKYPNINLFQKGLSNKKGRVSFSLGGSSSTIHEDGEAEIFVDSLDHLTTDSVSFIKIDIEGAEALAIEGAKQTILKHHPRLAIAVYHKPDDLWKIPDQVLSIRSDYKLYLRHYTEGVVETVMYFIPERIKI